MSELAGRRLGIPLNKTRFSLKNWLLCYTLKLLQTGANHFQNVHFEESLELSLQNFSFYFPTDRPSWSFLANGKHSSIQEKLSALITIKKIGKKDHSEILVTGSHERLKLAIRNYFGVRNFLANYFVDKKDLVGTSI